ncbi:MAG: hypothetical protein AAFX04_04990 [Pseudomonadota bacterium]
MAANPQITRYDYNGKAEPCLVIRPDAPTKAAHMLCLIPPLFAEANRMRRLMVSVMRYIATTHHIASMLPDLPGTMDSRTLLADTGFTDWQKALAMAAEQCGSVTHSAAIRGGAALDGALPDIPHWRLSPIPPAQQLRTLARSEIASLRDAGEATPALSDMLGSGRQDGLMLAGYTLGPSMVAALMDRHNIADGADRTVRLAEDTKPADARLDGPPLWLRAEPGDDQSLATAIAGDIAQWMTE